LSKKNKNPTYRNPLSAVGVKAGFFVLKAKVYASMFKRRALKKCKLIQE
jgi:hypothetical protein